MKGYAMVRAWTILALLLAACVPDSRHPLSDPDKAVIDSRLTGLWVSRIDDEDAFVHFLPKGESEMDILTISYTKDGGASWSAFTMFSSRIGDEWYMNVRASAANGRSADEDKGHGYFLYRYRVSGNGELMVWSMAPSAAVAAIESGLAGTVRKGKWTEEITITAPTGALAGYVGKSDPEWLFGELVGTFRRKE